MKFDLYRDQPASAEDIWRTSGSGLETESWTGTSIFEEEVETEGMIVPVLFNEPITPNSQHTLSNHRHATSNNTIWCTYTIDIGVIFAYTRGDTAQHQRSKARGEAAQLDSSDPGAAGKRMAMICGIDIRTSLGLAEHIESKSWSGHTGNALKQFMRMIGR